MNLKSDGLGEETSTLNVWRLPFSRSGKLQEWALAYLRFLALPVLVYIPIIVAVTWPLVTQLGTHLIGSGVSLTDVIEHYRMIWWVPYAFRHGLNPFYQSLFGYPAGFFSSVQWSQPLVYLPASLLSWFFGPTAALNSWILLILLLNGLAAYGLCLDILRQNGQMGRYSLLAALVGGLIFMIFPALQGHLLFGQINIISNYGLPIVVLCLYRIITDRASNKTAISGAVAIWIVLLGNYTGALFLIFPLVLFGGVYLLIFRPPQIFKAKWRILRQLIIVFGGAALLSLPFYLPLIADALDPAQAYYLKTQSAGWIIFSTDPLSFLSLSPFTPWTRPFALPFSYSVLNANITEGAAYLGVIAVLLVTVAVLRKREYVGLWVTLLLGTMLFSLGPMLKWQEQIVTYTLGLDSSHIVLPWALFQKLPLVDLIRTPGRFNLLTALPLGILAAIGLNELLSGLRRPAMRIAVSGLLIVGITAEYQLRFPFPTFSTSQPAYLQNLALRTDVHAVFDVPYLETHKQALLEQMAHHKAIIAGYYSRSTPVNPAKLMLLSEVARGLGWHADTPGAGFPGPSLEPDDVRSILKDNGIDVIIYHWALLDKQSTRAWALGVFGPPAYEDDQIGAFEVPAPAMHSTRLALTHVGQYWWPFSAPNDGWWPDQPDDQRKVGQDYSTDPLWLKAGARIAAYTPVATLQHFTLTLTPLYGAHSLSLSVDDHLFQVWTVNRPGMAADFWLAFQPGFHALQFSVTDGCIPLPVPPQCMENAQTSSMDSKCAASSATSYCLSMQVNHLQTADSGLPYHPVAIHLGRGMTLQGFRLPAEVTRGSHLLVETDWLAAQRLPGDYHLFIHVFSQDSKLLAQYDTIPNGGRFPTTEWAGSQPWSATASLPVPADAAPGTYEVYAGWYQYPDMTRLSVSGDGKHAADGLVYLASFTVR